MTLNVPLVSIGIPTYNRSTLLRRSIDTALQQDYPNIEVIVSDNASTDDTEIICKLYCEQDKRFKYIRNPENLGPTANFAAVMNAASGEYFMWLGNDDWLDTNYVSTCLDELTSDSGISLVSGTPRYYRNGQFVHTGKTFNLSQAAAWRRVLGYFAKVDDNGMFYGLMRTSQIRQLEINNLLGGDWLLIAALAFTGKIKVFPEVSVHRDLGGATTSHRKITETLGISRLNSLFPVTSIAANVWYDIINANHIYHTRPRVERIIAGTIAVVVILVTAIQRYTKSAIRRVKNGVKSRLLCTS
jgi:glycosyltransferase involved in cell wall biosynthesis